MFNFSNDDTDSVEAYDEPQQVQRSRSGQKTKPTHEQLQERSHEQDIHIQSLLLQYDQRKNEQKVNQWVSKASMNVNNALEIQQHLKWMHKGKSPESAVMSYFSAGMAPLAPPAIVKHCGLYPEDILELFDIYFNRVNPYFSLLDQNYHTPEKLLWNSPFLFTVVCAVASRYYEARPNLYSLAMEFARDCAGKGLVEGDRSVEVCQAYLILAVYPASAYYADRGVNADLYVRMATELELNQPPPPHIEGREALNRTRTWLNCYCVDGSHAIQFGKLPMLRLDDYIARNSRNWYKSSSLNSPYDVHLCGYVQMIIHMAKWREYMRDDTTRSERQPGEVIAAAIRTQDVLAREMDLWAGAYTEEYMFMPMPICLYRGNTTQMITAYLKLVVLLVGFQKTRKEDLHQDSEILVKSIDAARSVIRITLERMYPTGFLRYAMDASFLYVSFAAAFLINLFRPRFLHLLNDATQNDIIAIVSRLITVLGSNDVALDGRHTPALYARFLSSLMSKHGLVNSNAQSPRNKQSRSSSSSFNSEHRQISPSDGFYWPDIPQSENSSGSQTPDVPGGFGYQTRLQESMNMDFSLSHFIKIVTSQQPVSPPPSEDVNFCEPWQQLWKNPDVQPVTWSQPVSVSGWSP
ncbi:hypothetical protein CVT25_001083 [Psilocybe cyanescens]|uniref:Xylanolytic transcriptional activator regulatory domain-containing protein n=1 Tax=Psilocybe cyanescens TaxID=93625 RepID=A0A409XBA8_PSICY|nr:hypothetical protein CVT25_001083 [Psilocybe cyanescens]